MADKPKFATDAIVTEIAAERRRQIEAEGWTPEHDDEHSNGEMAVAAACYATLHAAHPFAPIEQPPQPRSYVRALRWPWSPEWWKPKDRRRNLIRAAALLVAEIERLDRGAAAETPQEMALPPTTAGGAPMK